MRTCSVVDRTLGTSPERWQVVPEDISQFLHQPKTAALPESTSRVCPGRVLPRLYCAHHGDKVRASQARGHQKRTEKQTALRVASACFGEGPGKFGLGRNVEELPVADLQYPLCSAQRGPGMFLRPRRPAGYTPSVVQVLLGDFVHREGRQTAKYRWWECWYVRFDCSGHRAPEDRSGKRYLVARVVVEARSSSATQNLLGELGRLGRDASQYRVRSCVSMDVWWRCRILGRNVRLLREDYSLEPIRPTKPGHKSGSDNQPWNSYVTGHMAVPLIDFPSTATWAVPWFEPLACRPQPSQREIVTPDDDEGKGK